MSDDQGEQHCLFPLGVDFGRLREVRADIMTFSRASSTNKTYGQAWKSFSAWCADAGRTTLPASSQTVLDYVTWQLSEWPRYRVSSIRAGLFALRLYHLQASQPNPIRGEDLKLLLRNAARKLRERPRKEKALTPKQLRSICESLEGDGSVLSLRDQAMILLCFAAGWRGAEICSLTLADISFEEDRLCVQLGASKTDQDGSLGRLVSIPRGKLARTCPVRVIRDWIDARGPWQGPLFCRFDRARCVMHKGITRDTVNNRLKKALREIGENAASYGSHSLRAGMATSAAEAGASVISIMQRTGHKQVSSVLRYVRPAQAFMSDPLAGVL